MSRVLTADMISALSASVLRLALFVQLTFGDNIYYLWTGLGPMTWSGMTFTGVGSLGAVSEISEDSNVEAKNVTISLSGIPSALVMEVAYEVRLLGTCNIWLACYNADGSLIDTPVLSYQGKMDAPEMMDDGQTCTVSISLENVLVDLNRPVYRRYTADDQQIDLAATLTRVGLSSSTVDTGFQHVPATQEAIIFWGRSPSSTNNV
jgi:hypothetical protein